MQKRRIPKLNDWLNLWFPFLFTAGLLMHAAALTGNILEPDSALYAGIAKRMAENNDFINLYGDGSDWLDKPHFPFWITALSFKLLGITSFACKLPAYLFWLMGAGYTWLLCKKIYGKTTAQLALLIYVTAAHLIISNFDVRAEPFLTGLITGSIYHLYCGGGERRYLLHIVAGALLAACAVMTKGLFVLIPVFGGLALHYIILKEWKRIGQWRWWLALLLTALFIIPELYCLYVQFDSHPEKIIFGKTGVSGIRFFLWDSQFGRFFNTGPIRGNGNLLFYTHTLLWAFMPWSLLLYAALVQIIRRALGKKLSLPEYCTLCSAGLTFVLFSVSKFQLPHYLNIVFPMFAIITAHYLVSAADPLTIRRLAMVQNFVFVLIGLGAGALVWLFRMQPLMAALFWTVGMCLLAWYIFKRHNLPAAIGRTVWVMLMLGVLLNLFFYPSLLRYQGGMQAAQWVNTNSRRPVAMVMCHSYSLEFYLQSPSVRWSLTQLQEAAAKGSVLLLTPADSLPRVAALLPNVQVTERFRHFPVSRLTMDFVYFRTRDRVLQEYVLASVGQ
jgi:4-amino-4-deoxy-L-arabinose transferase-like glycosyltransferase